MKRSMLMLFFVAAAATAQVNVQRVADDAIVLDRVAEVGKRDMPRDLMKRIIAEDIDLLRGKRADGTYEYARYERIEAGRIDESFSIHPRENDDNLQKVELKGAFVYRLIVGSPSRRLVVTKNRRVWVERVELEYVPEGSSTTKTQSTPIEAWLDPGAVRPIDFPEIARQATARVFARADKQAGYGNLVLTLVQARVVDNPDSPYADAVASAKAVQRALENGDVASVRAMATRMRDTLRVSGVTAVVTAPAPQPSTTGRIAAPTTLEPTPTLEIYLELQAIEDLLTGQADERREGLDKLHQLVRRLRPSTPQR